MENSKRYQMTKRDWLDMLQATAVIYAPVVLMLLDQLQGGEFNYKVLFALGLSVTIDTVRRFYIDYTKK